MKKEDVLLRSREENKKAFYWWRVGTDSEKLPVRKGSCDRRVVI